MKIVMLGDSAVGKTTVMVMTYGMMSQKRFYDIFSVRSENEQIHQRLSNAYQEFRKSSKYPLSTDKMDEYEYSFYVDNKKCMTFTLVDIRGEMIRDYDNPKLLSELGQADVVMLFFNGYDILNDVDIEETRFDLFSLLNTSFGTEDRQRMIMPVITQMDRVIPITDSIKDRLENFTAEIRNMSDKNPNLSYCMIPVACSPKCMMDLDLMMLKLMHFGYQLDIKARYDRIQKEQQSIAEQYATGVWNSIKHFFGMNPERERAIQRAKELQPEIDYYNKVMPPIEAKMKNFIDNYTLYHYISVKKFSLLNFLFG